MPSIPLTRRWGAASPALAQGVSGQPAVAAGHAAGCHGSGGRRAGSDSRAIDLAYEELSDGNHPRLYQPNVLPELHDLIVHEGISRDASTSWWEVVDGLFERGYVHEALQAQRYAVPLLADVGAQIRQNKGIQNTYEEHTINNVWRSLLDAIEAYVILKEPTGSIWATRRSSVSPGRSGSARRSHGGQTISGHVYACTACPWFALLF